MSPRPVRLALRAAEEIVALLAILAIIAVLGTLAALLLKPVVNP